MAAVEGGALGLANETTHLVCPPRRRSRRRRPRPLFTMGFEALTQRVAFFRHHGQRSPEERDLVRRLDIYLMTFGCVSQVIKYLDQSNISNAYVSGMKEDLGLYGNELNYFTTWFSVSYCIMVGLSGGRAVLARPTGD